MFATIDIPTMYESDNTIFNEFVFPDVISSATDKQALIDEILMASEDMESRYTRPSILKNRIGIFTALNKYNWDGYARTLGYMGTYNPTENVFEDTEIEDTDAHLGNDNNIETRALENTKSNLSTVDKEDKETKDLDGFQNHTHTNDKDILKTERGLTKTTTTKENEANFDNVNGFGGSAAGTLSIGGADMGSGSYSGSIPIDKAHAGGSKTETTEGYSGTYDTETTEHTGSNKDEYEDNGTDTFTHKGDETVAELANEDGSITNEGENTSSGLQTHTTHRHGNIGVSTSASIMTEEFDLVSKVNLNKKIVDDFIKAFCLLVY